MVNSAKAVRSASSGRFVSLPHDLSTERPFTQSHRNLSSFNFNHSSPTAANSFSTLDKAPFAKSVLYDTYSTDATLTDALPAAGRPPSKLSFQPHARLQSSTNGVTTTLRENDLPTVAGATATAVEKAISKQVAKQVASPAGDKEKRVLRSKDGSSRAKSNLVRFFPDFEDVVFGPSKEPDVLNADSTLFITEKKPKVQGLPDDKTSSPKLDRKKIQHSAESTQVDAGNLYTTGIQVPTPRDWTRLDLTGFQKEAESFTQDPLADSNFLPAHKRGERKEKQLRNIEKEHALHEKSDLERLMEELKGPDWLKTMGISGVTESEKKKFEHHRDHYIHRVRALLAKFSAWKEQERELKLKREEALAAREEAEEENESDEDKCLMFEENFSSSDDIDPSARQLQLEARSATRPNRKTRLQRVGTALPVVEHVRPFTSFYSKPYMRAAAMGNHRRGRTTTAFGLSLPDVHEHEFALPSDFVTEEAIIANARKRRRLKRQSNVNEGEAQAPVG